MRFGLRGCGWHGTDLSVSDTMTNTIVAVAPLNRIGSQVEFASRDNIISIHRFLVVKSLGGEQGAPLEEWHGRFWTQPLMLS